MHKKWIFQSNLKSVGYQTYHNSNSLSDDEILKKMSFAQSVGTISVYLMKIFKKVDCWICWNNTGLSN